VQTGRQGDDSRLTEWVSQGRPSTPMRRSLLQRSALATVTVALATCPLFPTWASAAEGDEPAPTEPAPTEPAPAEPAPAEPTQAPAPTSVSGADTAPVPVPTAEVVMRLPGLPAFTVVLPVPSRPELADPAVMGLEPAVGTTDGGTRVRVTGLNLTGATQVLFGGVAGSDLVVTSATELWVTAPQRPAEGDVNVRVVTGAGRSASNSPVDFRFVNTPLLSAVTPASGSAAGGTLVSISGTELDGTTKVTFGEAEGTVVTVAPDRVRVIAPPHDGIGPVDVRVTTPGGTTTVAPTAQFQYAATPVVDTLSPTSGSADGGTEITMQGSRLTGATQVTFGGVPGTGLTVVSDTELVIPPLNGRPWVRSASW
jgi:hypothetical protein